MPDGVFTVGPAQIPAIAAVPAIRTAVLAKLETQVRQLQSVNRVNADFGEDYNIALDEVLNLIKEGSNG
jgi:hypothetical protein